MLRSFNSNGYKVYALSAGKTDPMFHVKKKAKTKKSNSDENSRVELIHDLEFPQACNTVDVSPDHQYIIATGVYPPQIGIYDTNEMTLKHRRGIDHEVLKTAFLEEDYTKLAFLCKNRVIEFHDRGGKYYSVRIPKEGRDMKYISDNASIFTVSSNNEVYRLNLEKGAFEVPLKSVCSYLNCIAENPIIPVVSAGGQGSILESWDLRCQKSISQLLCNTQDTDDSVTYCTYDSSGMKIAVGTANGYLKLYDIRNTKPLWERLHVNEEAVKHIEWVDSLNHAATGVGKDTLIAWSDHKSVRIQNSEDGDFIASIEGLVTDNKNQITNINSFRFFPDTGICFVVGDHTRVGTYFLPTIGAAPQWCSFLENITEEMEIPSGAYSGNAETQAYEDFVFVTKDQLEELNALQLIGTNMLKDYMHGYFIDRNVYHDLKDVANNFDYEAYRKKKIQEKIDAKRNMRLPLRKKKVEPVVNEELQEELRETAEAENKKGASKKQREKARFAKAALQDERFARIFTDENFAIERVDASEINKSRKHLDN